MNSGDVLLVYGTGDQLAAVGRLLAESGDEDAGPHHSGADPKRR